MNNTKYIIQTVIIIALLFVLNKGINVGKDYISNKPTISSIDTSITIVQYIDSSKHTVTNNNYKTISENTIINNTKIDTQALIKDYFTQRIIKDNYSDTNIKISILDTLYQNKLQGRTITYQNLKPTQYLTRTINKTNTIVKEPSGFYLGAGYLNGIVPNISYVNKNFMIGTGLLIQPQPQPYFNINFKIK